MLFLVDFEKQTRFVCLKWETIDMPLLAASLRNMLWNMPASYAIGGAVVIITIVGLWAASRW